MSTLSGDGIISLTAEMEEVLVDPINVEAAVLRGPGCVGGVVESLVDASSRIRSILVDAREVDLNDQDRAALVRAAMFGMRVTIIGPPPLRGFPPLLVQQQPDFRRAFVAAIYCLPRGQGLRVLTAMTMPTSELICLVRHALRGRAALVGMPS